MKKKFFLLRNSAAIQWQKILKKSIRRLSCFLHKEAKTPNKEEVVFIR